MRAKPISCVTTIIVRPSSASACITFSTSPTSSGSSADVGSSNNITSGSIASARAIATRCCWPPDRCDGYFASTPGASPTFRRYSRARASASARDRPSTLTGASVTFSSTVMCAHRLKCWNTIASFTRISCNCFGSPIRGAPRRSRVTRIVSPPSVIAPEHGCSRKLMQRRNVLFPEPLEPMMLITSPAFARSEMPLSTSLSPNFLCRSSTVSLSIRRRP
ncbi:hypothetical protein DM49_3934 [Burkholderia mallei]|nr:hypothetical protein DM75_3773 [Burkholderia mallei]KOS76243.1 hypothetical protein DM46_2288 [Burkholderia mallei]KOS94209.1 hypothetical protein DM45_3755 [Burkholderia mallei]KOS95253.1 hypothetical protein DM49_3934 [Burkholderia mallei]KOT02184.1 hypothetical protein DM50_3857 [Burkholderia mallei]